MPAKTVQDKHGFGYLE